MSKFRLSFPCDSSQVANTLQLLDRHGFNNVMVKAVNTETPVRDMERPSVVAPPNVKTGPLQHKRHKPSQAFFKPSMSGPGRVILKLFANSNVSILHAPDFIEALYQAGYSGASWFNCIKALVVEGAVVRCSRGSYRLPLEREITTKTLEQITE